MPEIFRASGFSFVFFSREHEPMHIHVIGKGGDVKYLWNGQEFVLCEQHGINANDLRKIKKMIDEKKDLIIRQWEQHFKNRKEW